MIRKWYFSLSEASIDRVDHGWRGLTRVAVASALRNTSLQPHMLYDGKESAFTAELRDLGVTVIPHRVGFYDKLVEIAPTRSSDYLGIALGVFPRVEIPVIEQEEDFVLFTDCDVVFLGEPELGLKPRYFAAAPQSSQTDYDNDMNAGIMIMNVKALRDDLPQFTKFITDHLGDGWPGCDQENYRRFYKGKWDRLSLEDNWKPYWGYNPSAKIVHWHGPKPQLVRRLLADPTLQTNRDWTTLFERNKESYAQYVKLWDGFTKATRRDIIGYLDVLTAQEGGGWAICMDDPFRPITMDLVIDGITVRSFTCGAPRRDIKAAYGVEAAGFTFSIPARFDDGQRHKIELRDDRGFPVALKRDGKVSEHYWFQKAQALASEAA